MQDASQAGKRTRSGGAPKRWALALAPVAAVVLVLAILLREENTAASDVERLEVVAGATRETVFGK